MSQEPTHANEVWWIERPAEPSRMAKLLQRLRLRSIPHVSSHTETLPYEELKSVRDEKLREALARQATHNSERSVIVPVAHADGTFSHVNDVRRGSLGLDDDESV